MSAKLKEEIAISIEKINYLFKNILSKDTSSQKLELALLKKYAAELRDEIAAFEESLFGAAEEVAVEQETQVAETPELATKSTKADSAPVLETGTKSEVPDVEEDSPNVAGEETINPFITKPNLVEKASTDESLQKDEEVEAPEPAGDSSKIAAGAGLAGIAGLGVLGAKHVAEGEEGLANKVDSILDKLGPDTPEEISMDTGIYDTSEFITENLPPLRREVAESPADEAAEESAPSEEETEAPAAEVEDSAFSRVDDFKFSSPAEETVPEAEAAPEEPAEPIAPPVIEEKIVEIAPDVPATPVVEAEPETLAQRIMRERRKSDEELNAPELDEQATQLIDQSQIETPAVSEESLNVYKTNHAPPVGEVKTQVLSDMIQKQDPPVVEPDPVEPGTLNDTFKKQEGDLSQELASKANGGGFVIGFNQRYKFVNELFNGDEGMYERTLQELGSCKDYISALAYLNLNVKMKYRWNNEDPTAKEFNQIIRQKFV